MGDIWARYNAGRYIIPQTSSVFFTDADFAGRPVEHFDHRGADNAREFILTASDIIANDTTMLVRSRTHGSINPLTRNDIGAHDAVAAGIDIRIAGLAIFINDNRSVDL